MNDHSDIQIPQPAAELTFRNLLIVTWDFVRFLFSKWLILVIFGITGGIIGIIYEWIQKPSYEAVLTFSTDDENTTIGAGSLAGIAAQFGFDLGGAGNVFSGDNIIALMQSRKILTSALLSQVDYKGSRRSLLNIYYDASGLRKSFQKSQKLKNVSFPETEQVPDYSRLQDSVFLLIIKKINADVLKVDRPDKKIVLYEIRCVSPDEIFSANFAKALINETSKFYIENKTRRSKITVDVLQRKADSIRYAYDAALSGRALLSDANINPAFQVPQVGIQKKQTDITVLSTAYGEILKNLEIAKFNLLRETPLITVIDEPLQPLRNLQKGRLFGAIVGGFIFGILGILYLMVARTINGIRRDAALAAKRS